MFFTSLSRADLYCNEGRHRGNEGRPRGNEGRQGIQNQFTIRKNSNSRTVQSTLPHNSNSPAGISYHHYKACQSAEGVQDVTYVACAASEADVEALLREAVI